MVKTYADVLMDCLTVNGGSIPISWLICPSCGKYHEITHYGEYYQITNHHDSNPVDSYQCMSCRGIFKIKWKENNTPSEFIEVKNA